MFIRQMLMVTALSLLLTATESTSFAQYRPGPPGGGGYSPSGRSSYGRSSYGSYGRGPGNSGGGDRVTYMGPQDALRRMDTNQNGVLEPNEISDRARPFINRAAERVGIDPNKPISLDKLTQQFGDSRRDEERRREQSRAKEEKPSVLGFGSDDELPKVPGFNIPPDSPLLSKLPLEKRYNKRILDQMNDTLRRYDRNRDGVLDANEMKDARWSYGDPKQNDLDGDGRLSKVELAERYAARYGNSSSSSNSYRSSSSSGSSSSSNRTTSSSSGGDKMRSYAESLMRQYDKNKNNVLERDEFKDMRKPERYNRNNDSVITMDELMSGSRSFASGGSSSKSNGTSKYRPPNYSSSAGGVYKVMTTAERLVKLGVSSTSSFIRDDKNGDGQLQMAEFSSTWNDAKLAEFQELDLNGDFVITPQEWLEVEKEKKRK